MKNIVATVIAKGAKNTAVKNANSACALYFYQPKEPKELKKLRKF
ncbi:MAG: cyclic lactone autoinducer peptide [Roseburia sp.]|nr:cyclic lactone autoinducer peptide [Lachnospiraceae bacterium]MCM1161868.1 cyclic lactone autoinducer peptide [Roseburia sp.]MCM1279435.1 cyclic lactone autoinducer peptide [Robinsoniella sp.]